LQEAGGGAAGTEGDGGGGFGSSAEDKNGGGGFEGDTGDEGDTEGEKSKAGGKEGDEVGSGGTESMEGVEGNKDDRSSSTSVGSEESVEDNSIHDDDSDGDNMYEDGDSYSGYNEKEALKNALRESSEDKACEQIPTVPSQARNSGGSGGGSSGGSDGGGEFRTRHAADLVGHPQETLSDGDEGGGVDAVATEALKNVAKTATSLLNVIKNLNTLNAVKNTLEEEELVHVTQMAVYCGAILKARDVRATVFFADDGGSIPEVATVTGVVVESDRRAHKKE
jgi:hypothetical protein